MLFGTGENPQIIGKCSFINEFSKSLVVHGFLKDFLKIGSPSQARFCQRVPFNDI
jgi:hypothetical protein